MIGLLHTSSVPGHFFVMAWSWIAFEIVLTMSQMVKTLFNGVTAAAKICGDQLCERRCFKLCGCQFEKLSHSMFMPSCQHMLMSKDWFGKVSLKAIAGL